MGDEVLYALAFRTLSCMSTEEGGESPVRDGFPCYI